MTKSHRGDIEPLMFVAQHCCCYAHQHYFAVNYEEVFRDLKILQKKLSRKFKANKTDDFTRMRSDINVYKQNKQNKSMYM